jgi:hypothetical protein
VPISAEAGAELTITTTLTPPAAANQAVLRAVLVIDGTTYSQGFERIEYDHIPAQTLLPTAATRVILLDVKTHGSRVGYIPGAGDRRR